MYQFILKISLLFFIFGSSFLGVSAQDDVTWEDAFIYFSENFVDTIPSSYQYIDIFYTGIEKKENLKKALQILVYSDKIKNKNTLFYPNLPIATGDFLALSEKILEKKITPPLDPKSARTRLSKENFEVLKAFFQKQSSKEEANLVRSGIFITPQKSDIKKSDIFFDVYKTLTKEHYNTESFEENTLIEGAIRGLTESTDDKYTSYFPPVQGDNFLESLEGEYEGIGAYVELQKPGYFIIVSPMVGSPSEKAGLKGGDQVLQVGERKIQESDTAGDIISWIKGPKGTEVELIIYRATTDKTFSVSVVRNKIVVKEVSGEAVENNFYYIQIKNFGDKVDTEFSEVFQDFIISGKKSLIIDLRNNPGGYLDKVSIMLSHFVETGSPVAITRGLSEEMIYESKDIEKYDISDKKIFILQNAGSASASEIMIGTLKDYYPQIQTVGEKTFGKGSVQTLKKYYDGSVLKYTTARWYTGKSQTAIDGIGIAPDIEIIEDKETEKDEVLEYVLQK